MVKMTDFETLHNQIQEELTKAFCIPKEYFYQQPDMGTIKIIKDSFKKLGIKRYKVIVYDHQNVILKVPKKNIKDVKKLVERAGMAGVTYEVQKLWFFQCRFKKIQIIE